jgi:3-oxoadipate enol-lactonase
MQLNERGIACELTDLVPPWRRRGPPVVFHHGIGTNRDAWAEWLPAVAARHPAWRFDLRGFGESAPLPVDALLEPSALMDQLIDDLFSVAPANAPVHLVGESAGGTIVLAAALRSPERVASVTISNAAISGQGIGQIDGWRALFDAGIAAWNARMMDCRFAPGAVDATAAAWYAKQQMRTRPETAMTLAGMLAVTDLRAALRRLRPPLLVLIPDSSPFIPVGMYDGLDTMLPDAEKRVFAGVRHGLPFSHAAECTAILLDFIARRAP